MHQKMNKIIVFVILIIKISLVLTQKEITLFVASVPKYYTPLNEDIFLTGTLNNWNLKNENYKLTRLTHNTFTTKLSLAYGNYEYKFSRGSAETVETAFDGTPKIRTFSVNENLKVDKIDVNIENWSDMIGNHSASGNVMILHTKFPFPTLNTTKKILIYLPPDYYTSNKRYPVFYVHDGHAAFDVFLNSFNGDVGYDEMMENFHLKSKQTSILVGIPQITNKERTEQLTPFPNYNFPTGTDSPGGKGDLYLESIVSHLKPFIDENFRTKPHRNYTGIIGYSLGGLISFYAGIKHQKTFSKIGAFSATYLWNDTIYSFANNSPVLFDDTKFYCIVGLNENATFEGVLYDMITTMNKMVKILRSVGYKNVFAKVYKDGEHDDWFWSREFPRAFTYFFLNESSSSTTILYFNYWKLLILILNLRRFL